MEYFILWRYYSMTLHNYVDDNILRQIPYDTVLEKNQTHVSKHYEWSAVATVDY